MTRCFACAFILAATWGIPIAHAEAPPAAPDVVGRWQTIDDDTHLPASIVLTALENGKLVAHVEKIVKKDVKPDVLCTRCVGEDKDKPVAGLKIMWDMTPDGDSWTGGQILDPDNGKIYRCKVKAVSTTELEVRGFIGISLFGRTQTWHRVP